MKLAKYIQFPTVEGPVRLKTRAYRDWRKRTQGVSEDAWPGAEIVAVETEAEAYTLARRPLSPTAGAPCRQQQRTPVADDPPVPNTSYPSSILKHNSTPTFVCLHLEESLPQCQDTAFKLWMVICAHARMTRTTKVKITGYMYRLAGIDSHHKKARALASLERSNLVKVHRQPGKAPVVTVKLNKGNYPVPFTKASSS